MSLQSRQEILTENRKGGLLEGIMAKYKECKDEIFLHIAINHLTVYEKYLKAMDEKGPAAFPNRLEYQKFEVAKLFLDRVRILDFSVAPSFKGYKEYKDKTMPPVDSFGMTPDIRETKKIKFCQNLKHGDILHLRVVEELETEYKLLVINKYDDNERVIDYSVYAYFVKSCVLDKLPRPLKVNDYIRAAIFGTLKMEQNVFSKLLVTMRKNLSNEKYKDVNLGLIHKSEILFYPEDISHHKSFLNYMHTEKNFDDPQEMIKCTASLGIDPYKIYSFDKSVDGKKLGKPKEIDSRQMELMSMNKSMDKIKEAEKRIIQGMDVRTVLPITEEALEIYPQNDAAYAIRGQLWNRLFIVERDTEFILKALDNCERSLQYNIYNLTATRVYLTVLLLSAELYKEEGNKEVADKIESILARCKYVCDVSGLLAESEEEEEEDKSKQSSTGKAQSAVVPMDISEG